MRRAGITQKDIDNARKSQEMNIIEDCKKFRHIHNHVFWWCLVDIQRFQRCQFAKMSENQNFKNFKWSSKSSSPDRRLYFLEWTWYLNFSQFSEMYQIGDGNKMSDGYEIKERTVKIWIMLIMKGQQFFISRQHTDILSWLDIYYHKERSKFTPEKIHWSMSKAMLSCLIAFSLRVLVHTAIIRMRQILLLD